MHAKGCLHNTLAVGGASLAMSPEERELEAILEGYSEQF